MDKFDPGVTTYIAELQARIEKKRDALERPAKGETKYEFLRGEIKALRFVIADLTGDPDDESTS